jgi:hypothetical protein
VESTSKGCEHAYYKKKQRRPTSKKKKVGKNTSPRNRKACHSVSTALLQSVGDRNPKYHEEQQKDVA